MISDGGLAFGDTNTMGDYARGTSEEGVTTGGIYGFDRTEGAGMNQMLGVQPSDADFTPGTITLRVQNTTGSTVSSWNIAYDAFYYNDESRSNSIAFAWSTDNDLFTSVPALLFTSPEAADAADVDWSAGAPRSTTITTDVANLGNLYLQWIFDDVSGAGSRDPLGIDNISVTAVPEASVFLFGGLVCGAFGVIAFGRRLVGITCARRLA
jgi:hypothetical protein